MKKTLSFTIPQLLRIYLAGVFLGIAVSLVVVFFRQWENRVVALLAAAAVTMNVIHTVLRRSKSTEGDETARERHESSSRPK